MIGISSTVKRFWVYLLLAVLAAALCFGAAKYGQQQRTEAVRTQAQAAAEPIFARYGIELSGVDVWGGTRRYGNGYTASYYTKDFGRLSAGSMYNLAERLEGIYYKLKDDSGKICLCCVYSGHDKYYINTYFRYIDKNGEEIDSDFYNSPFHKEYEEKHKPKSSTKSSPKPLTTPAPSRGGEIFDTSPDVSDFSNPEDFYDYYYYDFFDYYDAENYYYDHGGE